MRPAGSGKWRRWRGIVSETERPDTVIASEAKQSIERQNKNGLLRRFAPVRKRFAFIAGNDEDGAAYLPGRNSKLSNPAAMLTPTWPCTLSGCSAIELAEPPTSTLPPTPTPSVALPCAPT